MTFILISFLFRSQLLPSYSSLSIFLSFLTSNTLYFLSHYLLSPPLSITCRATRGLSMDGAGSKSTLLYSALFNSMFYHPLLLQLLFISNSKCLLSCFFDQNVFICVSESRNISITVNLSEIFFHSLYRPLCHSFLHLLTLFLAPSLTLLASSLASPLLDSFLYRLLTSYTTCALSYTLLNPSLHSPGALMRRQQTRAESF